jgi:hypothetical protein
MAADDGMTKSADKKSTTTTTMMQQQEQEPQEPKNNKAAWKIAKPILEEDYLAGRATDDMGPEGSNRSPP